MEDFSIFLVQEIARVALKDDATLRRIGDEMDVTDELLQKVSQYLNLILGE